MKDPIVFSKKLPTPTNKKVSSQFRFVGIEIDINRVGTVYSKAKSPETIEVLGLFFFWWRLMDSNHRPLACEASALTS